MATRKAISGSSSTPSQMMEYCGCIDAAEKWKQSIIEAVIRASDLLAPEEGEGSPVWLDIGATVKRCKAAWGEIETFAQSSHPENDLENLAGFAFFAGIVYATRSGGPA